MLQATQLLQRERKGQRVTPEEREAARAALQGRMRKQELARQTREARVDPVVRAILDDAFARLCLLDPERHFRDAIACDPRDAIVDAIAIFAGKRNAGTLPDGVDARYLLGIVKNVHHVHEAKPLTEALIRERLVARDRFLEPLVVERDAILAAGMSASSLSSTVSCSQSTPSIDTSGSMPPPRFSRRVNMPSASRSRSAPRDGYAAFRRSTRDRDHLVRSLLRRLWPLE